MSKFLSNLVQRGQSWYATREIPPALRPYFGGKRRFVKALGTRDQREANRLKHAELAAWEAELKAARRASEGAASGPLGEAREMQWHIQRARQEDERTGRGVLDERDPDAFEHGKAEGLEAFVDDRAEEVERRHGHEVAQRFRSIAHGTSTELDEATVESWLSGSTLTAKTKTQHKAAIRLLREAHKGVVHIEALNKRAAWDFLRKHLHEPGKLTPKTIRRYVSSYSTLWNWLAPRGLAQENPWTGQAPPKRTPRGTQEDQERPFTDAEITKLMKAAQGDRTMLDFMRAAALSGMRLVEIAQLRVKDTTGGTFTITQGKTKAAIRKVPIHSELVPLVARRRQGKEGSSEPREPSGFLFDELGETKDPDGKRSAAFSKRFGRFIRAQGIAEIVEGKRRSLVNFHSFRRWFITKAEQAGQPISLIEPVVGHKREGMTAGRYSKGPSEEQRREVVESVKLPE